MTIKKRISIENRKIEYTVRKHRRAKRLKITISCDGNCMVTLPWRMSVWDAEKFIKENSKWVLDKIKAMKKIGNRSIFSRHDRDEYLKLKDYAKDFVMKKLEKYFRFYGFEHKGVAIRNQRTRWGSCSSNGKLSFNYKVLFLPERHADYIIVHEICHLREFNHSKRFWNLVAKTIPEYEKIVEQLRKL
ncbi:MAG TPA: M48 family metallopeptidase [Candidatus Moranbacteria bacterium]|jgi:hypothetical protein|nr:M48 family metallopeptidase [Candidatus Moranbacteria bacterium]HOF42568.1 M48 family metallopeptidase [Candidatus Moranbacteria bacterium]HPX94332.1 M48 family metallopeptidase [Candidatus Moranbacteria bacterium]HQB59461.1 M48 family metallopeptidase [Candidatus Moranbacteria bacterium]